MHTLTTSVEPVSRCTWRAQRRRFHDNCRCLAQQPKGYFSEVDPNEGLKPLWGQRSKEARLHEFVLPDPRLTRSISTLAQEEAGELLWCGRRVAHDTPLVL
jgi:hypothetical protein